MIRITTGWIDTAGRTRTWALIDSKDGKLAEVTTKRGAYELKARLEAQESRREAEQAEPGATFILRLAQTPEGWALIDSTGRARVSSPNPVLLADNIAAIGDALIESAQMTSRLADVGVIMSGSAEWAVRA